MPGATPSASTIARTGQKRRNCDDVEGAGVLIEPSLIFFVMMRSQRAPQQHRDDQREDDHFLVLAGPERREALDEPDQQRAGGRHRIADEPADDRADESL